MNLQGLAIRRPVATLTILLIMIVIGTVSLTQTPLDLLPDIQPPVLALVTVYPGSSPQEVMSLVSRPIEENMAAVSGLTNIHSISQENISLVILQFEWGANIRSAREEVDTRIDLLPLPEGVNSPMLVEFDPMLLPVLELAVTGEADSAQLTQTLRERVVPKLESIPGVASVQLVGETREGFFVRLSPEKLQQFQVSFDQVAGILGASLMDFPAGIVELDQRQMRLRFLGHSHAQETLGNMIVGFQVDDEKLQEQLERNISVDLNTMLASALPASSAPAQIPMRTIYLRDLVLAWEEREGITYLDLDFLRLDEGGITRDALIKAIADYTGEEPVLEEPDQISLPEVDIQEIMALPVGQVPDFDAWYRQLQVQVTSELNMASEQIEKSLVQAALAMVQFSQGGGGVPGLDEDFPLQPIDLEAIAQVEVAPHPAQTISRVDGSPSIGLMIQKEGSANTVQVVRQVRRALDEITDQHSGIQFFTVYDQAGEIEEALMDLGRSLFGGAALAILVLLLFLKSWRTTLLIGAAIPVSILFTFTLLYFADLSINIMTMGGLALAAGLLVDNAIVVSENIYRHLQQGKSPNAAALDGSREIAGAIIASTLTTVSVFFPVVFIGGLAGELFTEFALTVTCALAASLLVSLTLIPLMASRFFSKDDARGGELRLGFYERALTWSLKKPWAPVSVVLIVLIVAGIGYTFLGSDLFPATEENSFAIEVNLPPGTPLGQTDSFVSQLEEILAARPELERYSSRVGSAQFYGLPTQGGVSNQGRIRVVVDPGHVGEMDTIISELRQEMEAVNPEAELYFSRETLMETAGMESRLELVIEGDSREGISKIAAEAIKELEKLPFLADVQFTMEDTRPEIHIDINHGQTLQRGVSVYQVANTLRMAIEGMQVARVSTGDEFMDLILSYNRSELATLDDLSNLGFHSPAGGWLRLGDVASFTESFGPASITRQDRRITGEIHAQYYGVDMGSASSEALAALESLELPEGYRIRTAGMFSMMDDVLADLQLVLIIAAILVYLVMAAQFESFINPLIIICSVPLAYAGSIFALWVTGSSLSVPAMIGGVVLAGVLVNDGIVMIDLISQKHREEGLPLMDAVIQGATARLRPVLMITITTILGVFPLALGIGAGSQLQAPMALTIIGGQLLGTILLLIFIPVLYSLLNRRTQKSRP